MTINQLPVVLEYRDAVTGIMIQRYVPEPTHCSACMKFYPTLEKRCLEGIQVHADGSGFCHWAVKKDGAS